MKSLFPDLGFGLGLRSPHLKDILAGKSSSQWFEALSENYMGVPDLGYGYALRRLETVRKDYPIVLHGVSMSIGSSDPLDKDYLQRLKNLIDRVEPAWVSDHLCWTGIGGHNSHDLLPLPYTQEAISHLTDRLDQLQNFLGRRFILENVSSYLEYKQSEMTEWDFIKELVQKSDCGLLLDINNVYVSSQNHDFDPYEYLDAIPWENVAQIHLAGFTDKGDILIDTHDHPVCPEVWDMLDYVYKNFGFRSTMVEWDDNIPPLPRVEEELNKARSRKETHCETKNQPRAPF